MWYKSNNDEIRCRYYVLTYIVILVSKNSLLLQINIIDLN